MTIEVRNGGGAVAIGLNEVCTNEALTSNRIANSARDTAFCVLGNRYCETYGAESK